MSKKYFETSTLMEKHRPLMVGFIYLILISLAEIIAALYEPFFGILCHIIILFGLTLHASLNINEPIGKMLLSLTLAPMIRIASYTVPLIVLRPFATYILIYFPIAVSTYVVSRCLNFKQSEVGLSLRLPLFQIVIAFTGFFFGTLEYLVLRYPPLIPYLSLRQLLLPGLILTITTGFVEEYVFRGTMQRACSDVLGRWNLVYISFLFAIVHIIHKSVLDIILVFFIALFFAWCVKKSGSILGVAMAHGITNITLFMIAPFLIKLPLLPL